MPELVLLEPGGPEAVGREKGDGLCVDVVPEVFTLLEDGIAYVCEDGVALNDPGMAESQAVVPEEHEGAVVRAALICPGECIFIERDDLT